MSKEQLAKFDQSIASQVKKSAKKRTILFTDIEESTKLWDAHGDVEGRLMVDRHNRLLFPIIRRYRGKIIKTIGDAIMASFRSPVNAVRAAIAIQQILEKEREEAKGLSLKVRIGIHSGKAIVEDYDVYGDVVNVAARVESQGKGNDIIISGLTFEHVKNSGFSFKRAGSFTPRGKKKPMKLYKCVWEDAPLLTEDVKLTPLLPVGKKQKLSLLMYICVFMAGLYFVYFYFARFLLAENETIALLLINPKGLFTHYPMIVGTIVLIPVAMLFFIITRMHLVNRLMLTSMRICKGGFYFTIVFVLLKLVSPLYPLTEIPDWNTVLWESRHLFVEVVVDDAVIHNEPSLESPVLTKVGKGTLLLLRDVQKTATITWNKIPVEKDVFGWIPRVTPARIGVPEMRVTLTQKFFFRQRDLAAFVIGLLGFLFGFISFRIRPY